MFNVRKHENLQFLLTRLDSCKKFKEMILECKAKALEEQSSCALCTSFVHKRERGRQATPTCGVSEANNLRGREQHQMLHLYKSS